MKKNVLVIVICIMTKVYAQDTTLICKVQFNQFINKEVSVLFKQIKATAPSCLPYCVYSVHLNYIQGVVISNDSVRIEIRFKEGIRLKEKDIYHADNPCKFRKYSIKGVIVKRISIIDLINHREVAIYE